MFQELNENNFNDEISKGLRLVDFYADWCGYCKKQQEVLDDLSKKDFWIGKLNCDKNVSIAQNYGITGLPTLILFKNGKAVEKMAGYHTKSQLLDKLIPHLN